MWTDETPHDEAEFVFEAPRRRPVVRPALPARPRQPAKSPRPRPLPGIGLGVTSPAAPFGGGPASPVAEPPPSFSGAEPAATDLDDPVTLRFVQKSINRIFDELIRRARARQGG